MRNFARFALAFILVALSALAHAQQFDFAFGASTLFSSKNTTASQSFEPPPEKGGIYTSFSADLILRKHLGLNAEIAVRTKQGLYNGYQNFRPALYDVNALYATKLTRKTSLDLMAGIGGETLLFYNHFNTCSSFYASCTTYLNSTHFAMHAGGGVRYYFWRRFFVRPEAHVYFIPNNYQFHSDAVARVGASIGYSFAPR